ncbi:unnamed protein product, partial [Rotaria magnacalcarata]
MIRSHSWSLWDIQFQTEFGSEKRPRVVTNAGCGNATVTGLILMLD